MRRLLVSLAASALLVASIGVATAQGPGAQGGRRIGAGMGGMQMGGLGLLRIKEVQEELKMTPAQVEKIAPAQQELRTATQEVMQGGGFQQMTPEERQKAFAKLAEMQTKAVASILDTTQMKRYRELELQRAGVSAFAMPAVAKELGITDDQKAKIQELNQKQQQDMRAAFQGTDFRSMTAEERQQMMEKLQAQRKQADEAVLALLTAAQKTKWTEMQGKPFKFPQGPGMGMRGGFGGQGGRQRGGPGGGAGGNPPA